MFHYRWAYATDVAHAAVILPRWSRTTSPEAEAVALGEAFAERQIGRLGVVGSNDVTAPVIEESYRRLLGLLDARLAESRFVMGGRPGASDFALYGQLTQLVGFDPTPRTIALAVTPRVVAWVDVVEDLSGVEPGDWLDRDNVPATFLALLTEMGRVYRPVPPRQRGGARSWRRAGRVHDRGPAVGAAAVSLPAQVPRLAARRPRRARAGRSPAGGRDPRGHGRRGAVRRGKVTVVPRSVRSREAIFRGDGTVTPSPPYRVPVAL